MATKCVHNQSLFLPFLYPTLLRCRGRTAQRIAATAFSASRTSACRYSSTHVASESPEVRLNPAPEDYASPIFADNARLTLYAGPGGNGCISFLRDLFLPEGPPNGGDGGHGGNIYIQAVHGETSLHKLARRKFIRAGRGKHGQGSAKAGQRGEDVIITVPVGTVLREISREDPVAEEAMERRDAFLERKAWKARVRERDAEQVRREAMEELGQEDDLEYENEDIDGTQSKGVAPSKKRPTPTNTKAQPVQVQDETGDDDTYTEPADPHRHKWLLYPGASKTEVKSMILPRLPRRTRFYHQPPGPLHIDLSRPTPSPILLATGGIGGLGNPHFVSREYPRPIFATKGDRAVSLQVELELKLLADVGLVGLPNAGKSTLLRSLSNSRTRVGNWAFTTLQPNIGTVVLDNYKGRPLARSFKRYPPGENSGEGEVQVEQRTRFTVADIPGLIEGAHLDRGLGIAFLRHVERAGVLSFVIDLSAGNAVEALKSLWREVGLYAQMREDEERGREAEGNIEWEMDGGDGASARHASQQQQQRFASETDPSSVMMVADAPPEPEKVSGLHIASKPWFVVATKGDLPDTQENFKELQAYLKDVTEGTQPHPSGIEQSWTKRCTAIPVSAINGHGVENIIHWTVGLLDE